MNDIKEINFTVTKETLEDDILELYKRLFGKIENDQIIVKEMNGGNVNIICKVYKKNDEKNSVIFRIFGMKLNSGQESKDEPMDDENQKNKLNLDNLFNFSTALKAMLKFSENNLCERVFAKFDNGVCYKYTTGILVNGTNIMLTDEFLNDMSLKLAKLHTLKIDQPEIKFKTSFDRMKEEFGKIIDSVIDEVDDKIANTGELPYSIYPKLSKLRKESDEIEEKLNEIGWSEIVLCHNDLNSNNILWNEKHLENKVGLIDFELVLDNYAAIELSYLFTFYGGHLLHDFDKNLFPTKDYRLRFIRNYLKERNRLDNKQINQDEFEKQVNLLFIRTNLGILYYTGLFSISLPCFDLRKDIFNNPELDMLSKGKKYYLGKIGLKVYQFYSEIKDEFMKSVDDYLNNNVH